MGANLFNTRLVTLAARLALFLCFLFLVLYYRNLGLFLAYLASATLAWFAPPTLLGPGYKSNSFWLRGALIVPYASLAVYLGIGLLFGDSSALTALAKLPFIELPIDKVMIRMADFSGQGEMSSAAWYDAFYGKIYPAIQVSVIAAFLWCIAALSLGVASGKSVSSGGLAVDQIEASGRYLRLIARVCFAALICYVIGLDSFFLPGSYRSMTFFPLITTQLSIATLVGLWPFEIIRKRN